MDLTSRVVDTLPLLGLAFAFLLACECINHTVQWVRTHRTTRRYPPGYRRVGEFPRRAATAPGDNADGAR